MARQGSMKSGRTGKVAKMFGRHGSPQDAEGTIGASTAVAAAALKAEGAGANLEPDPLLTDCSRETPAAATLSAPQSSKLRFAVAFARIVSLLMRSQDHRYYALIDLEWLVVQPMLFGQFAVMEATVVGSHIRAPPTFRRICGE